MMHDAKHVAVAPRVAEHRHHHGHNHGAEEEVPVFVPSDQRQQKGMEMNQRRRPKSEGKAQNRHKGSPTKLFRSDKGDHGRGRLRNRTKSVPVRSKSVSETRGRSSVRRRKPALKAAAFDRRLKAAASEGQFSGLRRRARKSKQEAVHLTAGDLWSLNRSNLRCHCHACCCCYNHCRCHHNYHQHHGYDHHSMINMVMIISIFPLVQTF